MLARAAAAFQRLADRVVPDPFTLALALTLVVMLISATRLLSAGVSASAAALTLATGWLAGMTSAGGLAFALQMCLILVTGHALALSPPAQRLVRAAARLPRSSAGAALLVALIACVASVIHWGLGAITGALVAREVARAARADGLDLHYPLLGAAAYSGFAVWHGGLSGSAPLKVAQPDHFLASALGVLPVSQTLLSPLNLIITGAMIALIPALFWTLGRALPITPDLPAPPPRDPTPDVEAAPDPDAVPGVHRVDALRDTPWAGALFGFLGLAALAYAVAADALTFDINAVILGFLFTGLLLQGSLSRYVAAVSDGARGAGGIILQFPFYFGILGVMQAGGLIDWISHALASVASPTTFPAVAFLSAGLVNFFVPSGGGQWAVQGQVLADSGAALGVDPAVTVMAFAYGDAWTNTLQPFWALPLLGIMGLRARDIIGYTGLVFVMLGVVVPALLLLVAW